MAKAKKRKVELKTLTFQCSECGEFTAATSEVHFWSDTQECGLCGSHGSLEVCVTCKCGESVNIEINSW